MLLYIIRAATSKGLTYIYCMYNYYVIIIPFFFFAPELDRVEGGAIHNGFLVSSHYR